MRKELEDKGETNITKIDFFKNNNFHAKWKNGVLYTSPEQNDTHNKQIQLIKTIFLDNLKVLNLYLQKDRKVSDQNEMQKSTNDSRNNGNKSCF